MRWVCLLALLAWLLPQAAKAQGSIPTMPVAPGAEALGRGGAFAAKADTPLAIEYNVAGLAQLRGTQVLIDGQLWVPTDGGPCVAAPINGQTPCYGGLAAVTTDFGVLRRWTFAMGFRLPEPVTAYGLPPLTALDGSWSPAWPHALLMAPSLGVAVQAHRRLALGLLLEDAMALTLLPCPLSSYANMATGCSHPQILARSLLNPVVQLGLLGRLGTMRRAVLLAASVRSAPNLGQSPLLDGAYRTNLPWTLRIGARYLHRDPYSGRTRFDLELDGVAQLWSPSDLQIPASLGPNASDNLGLRLGGSYHVALPQATLVGRLGFAVDGYLPRPGPALSILNGVPIPDDERDYVLVETIGVGVQTRCLVVDLGYGFETQLIHGGPAARYQGDVVAQSHLVSLSLLLRL